MKKLLGAATRMTVIFGSLITLLIAGGAHYRK